MKAPDALREWVKRGLGGHTIKWKEEKLDVNALPDLVPAMKTWLTMFGTDESKALADQIPDHNETSQWKRFVDEQLKPIMQGPPVRHVTKRAAPSAEAEHIMKKQRSNAGLENPVGSSMDSFGYSSVLVAATAAFSHISDSAGVTGAAQRAGAG